MLGRQGRRNLPVDDAVIGMLVTLARTAPPSAAAHEWCSSGRRSRCELSSKRHRSTTSSTSGADPPCRRAQTHFARSSASRVIRTIHYAPARATVVGVVPPLRCGGAGLRARGALGSGQAGWQPGHQYVERPALIAPALDGVAATRAASTGPPGIPRFVSVRRAAAGGEIAPELVPGGLVDAQPALVADLAHGCERRDPLRPAHLRLEDVADPGGDPLVRSTAASSVAGSSIEIRATTARRSISGMQRSGPIRSSMRDARVGRPRRFALAAKLDDRRREAHRARSVVHPDDDPGRVPRTPPALARPETCQVPVICMWVCQDRNRRRSASAGVCPRRRRR